jgi:hypothetical protein
MPLDLRRWTNAPCAHAGEHTGLLVSRNRLLWGAIFFAVFLFGADMCATISRTGAHITVWAMVAVVTIAAATGAGWLAGMPAREARSPQPAPPARVGARHDVDTWGRYEDGCVEVWSGSEHKPRSR